jgi:site-specific DNA recombinase
MVADGFSVDEESCFVDDGVSGTTLIRPALERLRDEVANGALDRLYVHSPDRLARKYAYQALLVDEISRAGVEIIFLNHAPGKSPEDDLLLQVQGVIAEYERTKIAERSRRGKLHAARQGSVNVLSGAPYGYRYVTAQAGGGQARYEVIMEEARLVQQVFAWLGQERLSLQEVCRRLEKQGIRTPRGRQALERSDALVTGCKIRPTADRRVTVRAALSSVSHVCDRGVASPNCRAGRIR